MLIPPDDLAVVLDIAGPLWSNPSTIEQNGVHHGYRQVTLVANGAVHMNGLGWLLEPWQPVWDAWLSWLEPGGYVRRHIDAGPYRERIQLPITHAGLLNGKRHTLGEPFRVHQHEWHDVTNPDPEPRVVVVIDRGDPLPIPTGPFRLYEENDG